MSHLEAFAGKDFPTIGVELELQLVSLFNFNLATEAQDFLRRISEKEHTGEIKPEITQAMIEINSSIHENYTSLNNELITLRGLITDEARKTHIGICGGGTHPFQKWKHQRIYDTERFANVSEEYGYLAKQFTVFGQHIHIACPSGDDALYLCHALARYIPHFVALTAASPYQQGVDTSFDCSRLAVISAFPLSGTPPWILTWAAFETYFDTLFDLDIVKSMKDFYWDIRPKPEFSTVEIRICDTPLTVEKAAEVAAYAQLLVYWLLDQKPPIHRQLYTTYLINRFRSARYGFGAVLVDATNGVHMPIVQDILTTCDTLENYAITLKSGIALNRIREATLKRINGAIWLREQYIHSQTLENIVRNQSNLWMQDDSYQFGTPLSNSKML